MSEHAQFRPCIDLHNGKVKQIVGGTLTDSGEGLRTNFVSALPPEHYAELYARHHLAGGHVIMLGPGNEAAAHAALAACPGNLQIGGGITADNASAWLDAGAQKVIVTSFVFADGAFQAERAETLRRRIGRGHLVLDLSCRRKDGDYYIVTDRWQRFTAMKVDAGTLETMAQYADEFLIHAVDVEGKQGGIDETLLCKLAANSPVPCVYAGGITNFADVKIINRCGEGKIHYTIGSALDLFGGELPFAQVLQFPAMLSGERKVQP